MNITVTIIIPIYNEADNLPNLLYNLSKLLNNNLEKNFPEHNDQDLPIPKENWEIIFVNDGSNDHTLDILRSYNKDEINFKVINFSRNFGKENAILAGMDHSNGDCVIIMDGDLQHPIELIPEMLLHWKRGYHDVFCVRNDRRTDPLWKKVGTNIFYKILKKSSDLNIVPNAGDFRLLDRKVVNSLILLRESNRFSKGLYSWVGFKKREIPYTPKERKNGSSSFKLGSLLNLAFDGITSFSITPLRIATIIGFIVSFFAILYMSLIIIKTLIFNEPVQGYPSLMCVILFLGGIQLISIGVIGEYLGKLYIESKNRPSYIIESIISPSKQNRNTNA